jgi:NAD(P)H-quinone oxidoreductase subunit 5
MVDVKMIEPFFLILVPLLYVIGAITSSLKVPLNSSPGSSRKSLLICNLAFVAALAGAMSGWLLPGSASWLNLAPLAYIMLLLITLLGAVLARFSMRYLAGDPGQGRFTVWLQIILGAVSLIVTTNHLLVFLASWIVISVSLHQLLMFFPDRPRAALAAHKKFIFARLAEVCLGLGFALLYFQYNTAFIDQILAAAAGADAVPVAAQFAAVLMAVAALLKCAQLPFHGWLIQVVESPTPVSALLHAGVVNLGGFLMILMAPLISQVSAAQWLLLLVAGPTAVFASLVMMTRISVKVRLAWSTCAQMGWMLVECALGLYELALLHLVAHSAYKAHSFLNAGNAVELSLRKRLVVIKTPSATQWLIAAFLAFGLAVASVVVSAGSGPAQIFSWVVPGIALTILLSEVLAAGGGKPSIVRGLLVGAAFWGIYWAQKSVFHVLLAPPESQADAVAVSFVALLLILLVTGYYRVRYQRYSPSGARFYRFLFAAAYLDEWATRFTLKVWPAKLPNVVKPHSVSNPVEIKESV